MTKDEFMKQMQFYLIAKKTNLRFNNLSDYEAYFQLAKSCGISDDELIGMLGSPRDITERSYVSERKQAVKSIPFKIYTAFAHAGERLESAGEKAGSRTPGILKKTALICSAILKWVGIIAAIVLLVLGAVCLYMFSGAVVFPMIPALPVMSTLSLVAFAAAVIFFSAAIIYGVCGIRRFVKNKCSDSVKEEK